MSGAPARAARMGLRGSIRLRLTLWYAGALAVFLGVFAVASYIVVERAARNRLDASLRTTGRAFAASWAAEQATEQGRGALLNDVMRRVETGDLDLLVVDPTFRQVAARPPRPLGWEPASGAPDVPVSAAGLHALASAAGSGGVFTTLLPGSSTGVTRRLYATTVLVRGQPHLVVASQEMGELESMLRDMRVGFAVFIPIALLLAAGGGIFLAGRALAPVGAMAAQAERIGASTLHERLAVQRPRDEFGRLAAAFNDLLERVDLAFEAQRTFMAEASHELRTPIAVVRGESDVALSRAERAPGEYRDALHVIRDESRRMTQLVDDLLLLARADVGQASPRDGELYLDELVGDCTRTMRSLAAERSVDLSYAAPAEEMPFAGDEALLRRMVINLADNAIKHGNEGGTVTVRAGRDTEGAYYITVHNEGPPIPAALRHRIFERFFRVPAPSAQRTQRSRGAGLGLAIARWVAMVHGGTLELTQSDARGTEFRATLPAPAVSRKG